MMFGMNLSWTRVSHAQSKTGRYSDPVPLLIGYSTISWSLEPFCVIFRGVVLQRVYKTKLDSFKNDEF